MYTELIYKGRLTIVENIIRSYTRQNEALMLQTLKDLCAIPAPSGMEQKRSDYCKKWLEEMGAEGVYIDSALNVIYPQNCEGSNEITVFVAHTDTVFPDTEPMPYTDDGEKIYCPGVGDDAASLAVLLMLAKYYVENDIAPDKGILFVCNAGEEGLGNLKGTRQLFKDYAGRISQFISLDSKLNVANDDCAGSHRYEVEVLTEGGHSFQKFGAPNAIAELSRIVTQIYSIALPEKEGIRTTYNVGNISGGTSVNTIAQSAKMLCEYRSEDKDCLAYMEEKFLSIFDAARSNSVEVNVKKIGDRPCSNIDESKIENLRKIIRPIIEDVIHQPLQFKSASTDCNIPLSLGIPAMCIGVYTGGGSHTRQEWVEKASLVPGLEIAIRVADAVTQRGS